MGSRLFSARINAMMWLDEYILVNVENGQRVVRADISSDTPPSPFPTDGSEIEGLSSDDVLDKGSTVYVVADGSLYMMDSTGDWKAQ